MYDYVVMLQRRTSLTSLASLLGLLTITTLGAGCASEVPDDGDGVTLEGLTEGDAEREAARALAEADATGRDFEGDEGKASAGGGSGLGTQSLDLTGDLGSGTWAYDFRVTTDGRTSTTLGSSRRDARMMGASTHKLFTGFAAFANKTVEASTLTYMLRTSNNQLANFAMCKNGVALGRYSATCKSVTTATAAMKMPDAIRETFEWHREQGENLSSTLTMTDGSGLNTTNVLTVGDLVEVLMAGRRHARYSEWKKMLAQPGVSSTLRSRFSGYEGKLYAKTGTYHQDGGGVKSLAGYVELGGGRTLVFAVVGNGVGDANAAMGRIEKSVKKAVEEAR